MSLRRVRYQEETLDVLRAFLADARIKGPREAFEANTRHLPDTIRRDYADLTGSLQDAPSVCLRLPTGGGKTLLAARAIPIAGREFLDQEFPLVLWLVPTTAIRDQTYKALTTPGNMHYETMQQLYPGRLRILDLFSDGCCVCLMPPGGGGLLGSQLGSWAGRFPVGQGARLFLSRLRGQTH